MTTDGARSYLRTHTLSGEHVLLDLDAAEVELRASATAEQHRRAVTLLREDGVSVVLAYLRAGASLEEHAAPGIVTVQVRSGHVTVVAGGERIDAPAGRLVAVAARVRQAVHAVEDATLLITLSDRSPDAGRAP